MGIDDAVGSGDSKFFEDLLGATTGNVQGNVRGTFKECNSSCDSRLNQTEMDSSFSNDQCSEAQPSGSMVVRQVWQHNGPWVMSGRLRCQGVDSGRVLGGHSHQTVPLTVEPEPEGSGRAMVQVCCSLGFYTRRAFEPRA